MLPSSTGFAGSLKRFTRRAKGVFDPRAQTAESRTPSPLLPPTQIAKNARAHSWSGLKVALQLLEESDLFLPLKPAVAEFLVVLDIFEVAAQSREDYAELALNLQEIVEEFREHPGKHTSSKMSEALRAMESGLQQELEHMQEQRQHSGSGQRIEAREDRVRVQECHRCVETLCRELQSEALTVIWRIAEEQQLDARLEKLNAASTAVYDSEISTGIGRRKCTPGTRRLLLEGMRIWANDSKGPPVYWLTGMAGTGKTTLAYSFCAEMQLAGRLGASFFCSHADPDSRDVSRIIPAIAHQLARLLPRYREELTRQIAEDKDIGGRTTMTQFEKLVRDPLLQTRASVPAGIIVAIDGLDECSVRDVVQDILAVLVRHAIDLPIKFFVTCRPGRGLPDAVHSRNEYHHSVLELHDLGKTFVPAVQADIKTYLKDELASTSVSQEQHEQLAGQAGTLFIYAATALRYIDPKGQHGNFHRRLEDLLSIPSQTKTQTTEHRNLDDLYTAVLTALFANKDLALEEKETIRLVLDTAVYAKEPMNVVTMTRLLELDKQAVPSALQELRCVLHVSPGANLISMLDTSFSDFILSRERSGHLCSNPAEHSRQLALHCFSTMQRLLRFNICDLESSYVLDKDIPNLAKKINEAIPAELFYACRYWADYLGSAEPSDELCSALEEFLSNRLLFWMEVMNLRNCIGAGAQMLSGSHHWLQKSGSAADTAELVLDADRFATAFGMSEGCRSTPHIYISALPFWPETHPVRQRYWKHTRGLIRLEQAMVRKDLSCLAIWSTTSSVYCVTVSPDGTCIASGSDDGSIRVRDARNGVAVAGPFHGHTDRVTSVAFSPDSTRVVSCSHDKTIRVWDARSGDLVAGPLKGHSNLVTSVAFSPDGTRIVSGSHDETIRVWDARRGDLVAGPFKWHSGWVNSVRFSPDGTRIVSCSHDKTLRVWDARSGDLVAEPFKGHTNYVTSAGFSPDGTRIVSSSYDRTIRVWDAHSGDVVAGHSRAIPALSTLRDSPPTALASSLALGTRPSESGMHVAGLSQLDRFRGIPTMSILRDSHPAALVLSLALGAGPPVSGML